MSIIKKKNLIGIIISFFMVFFLVFPTIANSIMNKGIIAGRKQGYNDSYQLGYSDGFDVGYKAGLSEGMSFGYEEGYVDSGLYNDSRRIVYCTDADGKYHYDKNCSSSALKERMLIEALEHHLKPCSKCVPLNAATAP